MKKLMIACVAVAIAACAQAAVVNWTSSAVYSPTTGNKIGGTSGLYEMTLTFFESDGLGGWKEVKGITSTSTDTSKSNSKMAITTSDSLAANTQYGVSLFLETEGYTLQTDMATFTTAGNGDATLDGTGLGFDTGVFAMDTTKVGTGNGVWNAAAVPEPTSGLLLLLGMAGLALRRRRA